MKLARQAEILKLIHQSEIETQEELAAKLNERGFRVTQATVSRDIREMKLTKVTGENGKTRYTLLQKKEQDAAGRYVRVLKDAVISMDTAENILVIKTSPSWGFILKLLNSCSEINLFVPKGSETFSTLTNFIPESTYFGV